MKRQYLNGEKEQQVVKLATIEKATVNRLTIEALKKRLQRNLDTASEADWRFILDTLNAKVLAFGDGSWDLAIDVPPMSENAGASTISPTNSDNDSIVNNVGCNSSLV